MTLGVCIGIVGAAYVAGVASARQASYSERPPEQYLTNRHTVVHAQYGDDLTEVDRSCRALGVQHKGLLHGCGEPSWGVILRNPCQFGGRAAMAACAGLPLTVTLCDGDQTAWAKACIHEIGHYFGWPADHRR
jgi:hypothetical protein